MASDREFKGEKGLKGSEGVKGSKGAKGVKGLKGEKGAKGEKGVKGEKGRAAERFEDLHVYQRARELVNAIYQLTRTGDFARDFGLVDQIRRAGVSIMSNIAEGFERGSTTELIQYLFIAKGSCGEVRAQLAIACDQEYVGRADYVRLHDLARRVSGMLSNFIAHLQGSDYRGEKYTRPERIKAKDNWYRDFCDRHGVRPANYDLDSS